LYLRGNSSCIVSFLSVPLDIWKMIQCLICAYPFHTDACCATPSGGGVPAKIGFIICPGFGQDRVNFHQEPGGNTAGRNDPAWPTRAGYSIPCAIMLGSGWGELGSGKAVVARERAAAGGESSSLRSAVVLCILLVCIVVVTAPFVYYSVKLPLS